MPIYTVDIACRSTSHDYAGLFQALRRANAMLFLDARWLLDVHDDIGAVTRALLSHCAAGDGVFVTELAPETRWTGTGLSGEARAWIDARRASRRAPQASEDRPAAS